MDRTFPLAHHRGPVARRWRRLGLVALLLLLAASSTALWSSNRSWFQPFHVAVALPSGSVAHIRAWRPGPVYVPSRIDPASILSRPTTMLWLQSGPAGTVSHRGRLDLPGWPLLALALSLALVALSIGMWPGPIKSVMPNESPGASMS